MSDAGVRGYAGGMEGLLVSASVPGGSWKKRAMANHKVWHVGGVNRYGQYRPQHFVVPVVERAVRGGASHLMCLVSESASSGKKIKCDSGLVGDPDNIAKYLKSVFTGSGEFGTGSKMGYYYRLLNAVHEVKFQTAESPCKLYMEFDFEEEEDWVSAWKRVQVAVKLITARLQYECKVAGLESCDVRYVVAHGEREVGVDGKKKQSFHVVFYMHGFNSPSQCKAWLDDHVGGFGCGYDDRVYGRHQLMRLPWCGKHGCVDAILLPVTITEDPIVANTFVYTVTHSSFDAEIFHQFNINFYDYERKDVVLHEHNNVTNTRGVKDVQKLSSAASPSIYIPEDQYSVDMMAFFKPLLPKIQKKIQEHRRSITETVGASGVPTEFIVSPAILQSCKGYDSNIGIYHYIVEGDTFCEYDDPNFQHSSGQKTTIQINLCRGTYNQLCHACRPSGSDCHYYSLFELDNIAIKLFRKDVSIGYLELSRDGLASVFAQYFESDLVLNTSLCSTVIVYDEDTKLWVHTDRTKSNIIAKKKAIMKTNYIKYLTARYVATLQARKRAADKKEKNRINKEGLKLSTVPAFVDVKNFVELVTSSIHDSSNVISSLDPYPNLVALNDGQCYDVYTGELSPMLKHHYFTSRLNGCIKPLHTNEEDVKFVQKWFLEISAARQAQATYRQCLTGLFYTFLKLDRKFYVNLAPAGSNGKSVYRKMMKHTMTDSSLIGQHRYTNLNNKFFCLQANNGTTASAPRPDWLKMQFPSAYLVEELPAVKLDLDIFKIIASMDDYEARALYSNAILQIQIRGRLMVNTNYPPQLGESKPVWNRAVFIPWDTIYVEKKEDVDHANNRFLMDEQFFGMLKSKGDAFISVCLRALHKYLKPHIVDGKLTISELARPKCVVDFTEAHRAKHMSVEIFVNRYMRRPANYESGGTLTSTHTAYRQFLKDQGLPDVDFMTFCDKLEVHSYRTITHDNCEFFTDLMLNEEGALLASHSAPKGSIERGFFLQQQKKQQMGPIHLNPSSKKITGEISDGDEEILDHPHIYSTDCILNTSHCNGNHITGYADVIL